MAKRCRAALEAAVLKDLQATATEKTFATGDLSLELGKDPMKVPRFSRFANPPKDIQKSVMRMRALTRARNAFRTRSWEAAFSFTRISMRTPKFERFSNPPGDIAAAVQEMRLAAAAKRCRRQCSWAATFAFPRTSKKPMFERFANSPRDIRGAVEEMRLTLRERRAARARRAPMEDQVLIEDVLDEPEVPEVRVQASSDTTMKMLCAPPTEMEQVQQRLCFLLEGLRREVKNERSVQLFAEQSVLQQPLSVPTSFTPPEPVLEGSIFERSPHAQILEEAEAGTWAEPPNAKEVREACLRCDELLWLLRRHAEKYAKEQQLEQQRALMVDKLIQEEQLRYSHQEEQADREVERLIAEELNPPKPASVVTSKGARLIPGETLSIESRGSSKKGHLLPSTEISFAGSPFAAARQLRRSRSTCSMQAETLKAPKLGGSSSISFKAFGLESVKDLAYQRLNLAGTVAGSSAMEMDLGADAVQRLSKSSSTGALKVMKSRLAVRPLQPVVEWC